MNPIKFAEDSYVFIRSVHQDGASLGNRLYAMCFVSAPLMTVIMGLLDAHTALDRPARVLISVASAFLFAYIAVDRRRENFPLEDGAATTTAERFIFSFFVIINIIACAMSAKFIPNFAPAVYALFLPIPLKRIMKLSRIFEK